jgi:hypothetical protein
MDLFRCSLFSERWLMLAKTWLWYLGAGFKGACFYVGCKQKVPISEGSQSEGLFKICGTGLSGRHLLSKNAFPWKTRQNKGHLLSITLYTERHFPELLDPWKKICFLKYLKIDLNNSFKDSLSVLEKWEKHHRWWGRDLGLSLLCLESWAFGRSPRRSGHPRWRGG